MCPQAIALDRQRAVTVGAGSTCDVVIGASDLEPLHVCVYPFRKQWHICSFGETDVLQPDGTPTRTMALEPENTVFAGSLSLSLVPVRVLPVPVDRAFESNLDFTNEQSMVPLVDLEAAARKGPEGPSDRTAAA